MDTKEYTEMVRTLGNRYLEEYSRGVQQYTSVINDVARTGARRSQRAELGSAEFQRRYASFVLNEAPVLYGRLSEASLDYFAAVSRLGLEAVTAFVHQVVQGGNGPAQQPGAAADSAELVFHGVRGERASNAFLVTNNRPESIDLAFGVTEITAEDGDVHAKPAAEFTPSTCRLAPHARQVVQCSIPLARDLAAGRLYRGSITVDGYPDMAMPFTLEVEEPPAAGDKPAASGKKRQKKKKAPKAASRKTAGGKRAAKKAGRKKTGGG